MRSSQGLTLLELVVAIAVLLIGIFAAIQFQVVATNASSTSEVVQQLTRLAQAEIEWRRQTTIDLGTHECQTFRPAGYPVCTVTLDPCVILAGQNVFTCNPSVLSPIAYRVAVHAEGPRDQTIDVVAYHTGIYVAGATGSQGTPWEYPDDGETDPDGAPVTPGGEG